MANYTSKVSKTKVLIVDDEPDILEILKYNLKKKNFKVVTASNGIEALKQAKIEKPDLILLDVMMPEMDGIETCTQLKTIESLKNTIIVFLSARNEEFSQLAAFNAGADDYITKPVKPKVLISKIKALLRLSQKETSNDNIELKDLYIDRTNYKVEFNNKEIILPKKEFELLSLLASSPNKVFKREEILGKVWGYEVIVGGRTIDVHIRKLRERFGNERFTTIKGVGYKYNEEKE